MKSRELLHRFEPNTTLRHSDLVTSEEVELHGHQCGKYDGFWENQLNLNRAANKNFSVSGCTRLDFIFSNTIWSHRHIPP